MSHRTTPVGTRMIRQPAHTRTVHGTFLVQPCLLCLFTKSNAISAVKHSASLPLAGEIQNCQDGAETAVND